MQRTIGLESGWVMGTRYTVFSIEGHEATGNETMGNEASSKTVSFPLQFVLKMPLPIFADDIFCWALTYL